MNKNTDYNHPTYGRLHGLVSENNMTPLYYDDGVKTRYLVQNKYIYDELMPVIIDQDKNIWVAFSEMCRRLKLNDKEIKDEIRRCKKDITLQSCCANLYADCNYGYSTNYHFRKMLCIKWDDALLWMLKVDQLSLPKEAYRKITQIINKCYQNKYGYPIFAKDRSEYLENGGIYHTEKILQKAIVKQKYINNIKILKEEVEYDFGRIDLLGRDENDHSICIELKKDKEFSDTKEQLLRYKNSNQFDKVLYIAHNICKDMKDFLEKNQIEYLHYSIYNKKPMFY